MMSHVPIAGNVFVRAYRRRKSGLLVLRDEAEAHNVITTVGLGAWAYNIANTDGEVIDRILVGSGSAAAALSDTALGALTHTAPDIASYVRRDHAIVEWWLAGQEGARAALDGTNIREFGLMTADNGATASSNKLISRVVLPANIAMDADTWLVVTWNLKVSPTQLSGNDIWYDYGREVLASRIIDLSLHGALDNFALGNGTIVLTQAIQSLGAETYREAVTYTATGATVSASGTVTTGEHGSSAFTEAGFCTGTTAAAGVLYRKAGFNADNTSFDTDYTVEIVLADAFLSSTPAAPTFAMVFSPDNNLAGGDDKYAGHVIDAAQDTYRAYVSRTRKVANLRLASQGAPGAGETYTATLVKNGVATALTCTISGASATSAEDTVNEITLAAGDYVEMNFVASATASSNRVSATIEME